MFKDVPQNVRFPDLEVDVLKFWKEQQIYRQSLERRKDASRFVFFEGPPTANGMPHPGHCLTRAIKDLFPRYQTMRGHLCERKAGWDTHGLPVEVEVCKEMGIHSKEEIEEFGVEPFIQKCQQSVWRYMQEWEQLTERLGFWVDLEDAYVTYHQSYVESVWWSLKNLFDRNLLYQGHKIVWWWAQGGTALSAGEVGQGYREVADPSVYVKFPLLDESGQPTKTSLLVWTTTPWTLPSNQFAAVNPQLEYAIVLDGDSQERLIMASALVETIAEKSKRELTVESTCSGIELVGKRYQPPFDYYYKSLGDVEGTLANGDKEHVGWRVVAADFVTTDSGSGVVHQAPAFGEVDYDVLIAEQDRFIQGEGPELICAVGPDGKFTEVAGEYQGRWVKEADKDISRELRSRNVLFHLEQYLHDYPFCWRADQDPLIQYPRESWFIRTTSVRDDLLANNQEINWLPEHIRDGRFGNFLESNVDWALSRERYWGTPLPIWECEKTGYQEAIGDYAELLKKPGMTGVEVWESAKSANPDLADDLKVHKPYIDAITYDSPKTPGARMRRVSEVIDCWYDSGAMPFAQWGYPHQNVDKFSEQFPADFISEAIDQTRGWFYSQLAISTLMFGPSNEATQPKTEFPHPFRNCIVLGLMLGEDGQKMSKSKRNYREPNEIFDKHGADALRWYFFANQPPWTSIRYSERAIKDSIPEFMLRLWNVYSFFVIYAKIDGFDPSAELTGNVHELDPQTLSRAAGYRPIADRSELDRWILSELHRTIGEVVERMDAYDNFGACGSLNAFVDGLSNWYVRRSRDRYWSDDKESIDKRDAYWTLYECLISTSKLIAPFVPFLAEAIWQNLTGGYSDSVSSVHLCDYPTADPTVVDRDLSERMHLVRSISSLGRAARMKEKLKVRQPLAKVEVILADSTHAEWLQSHSELICTELNVKEVGFPTNPDEYISYRVQPNFKRLGPRVGKLMPQVKKTLGAIDAQELLAKLSTGSNFTLEVEGGSVELEPDDIAKQLQAKAGYVAEAQDNVVVVLSTELTDALLREGLSRDVVRLIQEQRKQISCNYTDRIHVGIATDSKELELAVNENLDYIKSETLATELNFVALAGATPTEHAVGESTIQLSISVA